ncbi:MAG: flagellar hook assembly protein FlgD [Elusimicrobiota bacterium]
MINQVTNVTTKSTSDSSSSTTSTSAISGNSSALGKNDFLKLLISQLQYQDPTNPMDNTEFVAQMAQYTSLEQMTNLNQSFEYMAGQLLVNQATGLIGKTVVLTVDADGNTITGTVEKVVLSSGTPQLVVNGNEYNLSQVEEIK